MKESVENHFVKVFENKIKEVQNTNYLIENEIEQIKLFTSSDGNLKEFAGDLNFDNETNSVFDLMHLENRVLFNDIYHQYLINGEYESILGKPVEEGESHLLGIEEDDFLMSVIEEAVLFADYYNWLKSLESTPAKQSKKTQLTQKEKLLALNYLNIDFGENESNKDRAKILSLILGLGEENIRKNLSYVSAGKNDVRTHANLKSVSQLFESHGFTDISLTIKKELEEL